MVGDGKVRELCEQEMSLLEVMFDVYSLLNASREKVVLYIIDRDRMFL